MKIRLFWLAWGIFFACQSFFTSAATVKMQDYLASFNPSGYVLYSPSKLTIRADTANPDAVLFGMIQWEGNGYNCEVLSGLTLRCTNKSNPSRSTDVTFRPVKYGSPYDGDEPPPSKTCADVVDQQVGDGNGPESPYCASLTYQGTALKCRTRVYGCSGGAGNWKCSHVLTAEACTGEPDPDPDPNPDPDPDPNPDPDPDPNPDPDPTPNPGTPGGGTQPGSGSTGGTSGSATGPNGTTNINLVMDFKPVTERLDLLRADQKSHTNYLGQMIANGTDATNSLKPLLSAIATKTDGVVGAVKEGTAELKGELNSINNTGKAIEGQLKDSTAELGGKIDGLGDKFGEKIDGLGDKLGEKLDGIKEGIDKLTEGDPVDGAAEGQAVELPDYDSAVRDGVEQIQQAVEEHTNSSGLGQFTDPNTVRGLFSAADSWADVFNLARSGCSPIPVGSRGSINLCPYTGSISWMLEIVIWGLTAIFIFFTITRLLARDRLT